MRNADTVLGVLRDRGGRGLPLERLYRQLFNPQLYLVAYGKLYSNAGAMTPGTTGETVDGMSEAKIAEAGLSFCACGARAGRFQRKADIIRVRSAGLVANDPGRVKTLCRCDDSPVILAGS